ncbi:MAG: exo-alpha-sialidase [Clostridia bacterium]|nr:exo-alpha-sialidase [Clostridia bacterium]
MERKNTILTFDPKKGFRRNSEGDFLRLKDGGIIFVYSEFLYDQYGDSSPCRISCIVSHDNGDSWSEPRVLIVPETFGAMNVSSVSLMRMQNGDAAVLFMVLREGNRNWHRDIYLARTNDEFESFYMITDTTPDDYIGKYCVNNSRLRRLSSGRLIYPISLHPGCQKLETDTGRNPGATSHTLGAFMYSDDDGYTWKRSAEYIFPPFTKGLAGLQEGEIFEVCPGVIKCYFRTEVMYQYESISFDNGDHWSVPQQSCFTSTCSPLSIVRNPYGGKVYAFWNPIPPHNGRVGTKERPARSPFAIAEVTTDGRKIEWIDLVDPDRNTGYGYTAIMFLSEDEAILGYCAGKPLQDINMLCRLTISKVDLRPDPNAPKSLF